MSGTDASDRDAARGATERDFPCCEVVGEGSDAQKAREARYGKVIWDTSRADEGTISATGADIVARAVMAVADAEQAELRAALVRVRALADAFADDELTRHGGNIAWHIEEAIANEKGDFPDAADRRIASQRARAESAEAALASERAAYAGLRARLEALADSWEQNAYRCTKAGDCPVCVTYQGVVIGLCRVLAAEPAAPVAAAPVAEEGDEQEAGEAKVPPECFNHAHIPWNNWCAPSGSDDTKGGATQHRHSRKPLQCNHVSEDCCIECCEPGGVRE